MNTITQEEISNIKNLSEFELVEYFQDNLVIYATGGSFENEIYKYVREEILKKKSLEKYLPKWVKSNRNIDQFWLFIKGKYGKYAERRAFLWNEFTPLLNYLELKRVSPLEETIVFDEAFIHNQWQKSIERKDSDPEAAITSARTLIESILKYILDEQNIDYIDRIELPVMYKEVAKSLNLAPENHQEQIFKQILGGVHSVITGLGALRNKLGDAHGKSIKNIKPKERHGELAVNLAGTMAIFLFKTFKDSKNV
jgi:hypothetical protein